MLAHLSQHVGVDREQAITWEARLGQEGLVDEPLRPWFHFVAHFSTPRAFVGDAMKKSVGRSVKKEEAKGGGGGGDVGTAEGSGGDVAMGKIAAEVGEIMEGGAHPYDFRVSGPRNLPSPNWRDLISSNWRDPKYKRMAISCFVQVAYLLELDRQENRMGDDGLAPKWWKPFKYKLVQVLVDERDGSIYGAVLEWDRLAAMSDLVVMRPLGAPRAVLALRGTLLKSPTARRDIEDDLRYLAWESLKGSVRFNGALDAVKHAIERYGGNNVCIGGHSLGASFALQVGKALAKEGVFVECHLFNPPSVSLAMTLRIAGEKAGKAWKQFRAARASSDGIVAAAAVEGNRVRAEAEKWMPYLYVNNSDYICCYYTDRSGAATDTSPDKPETTGSSSAAAAAAKRILLSKGPKKFLEAHGLQQWWSDDIELQTVVHDSKLLNRQLRSLYTANPQH
ncbi:GDSL esterase/lipase At4g10955-like [Ananas comosus]|uniref:GDSL esterase/lipase At4g10955-like n=1 Tax=Ananas comosus TaxID=4615 RepID=A0A6P5EX21_ANACO|nr:GDSL esterase/lipase At4g10955-like [Ananas comosus]